MEVEEVWSTAKSFYGPLDGFSDIVRLVGDALVLLGLKVDLIVSLDK